MKNIYILFLFTIILCSCRSTNFSCKGSDPLLEDFGRKTLDTVHVTREVHDSVYVFESEKTLSGSPTEGREGCIVDTLVKNHVEFRWRIRHDSVFCHKVDTVPYKVNAYKQVRYIPTWCYWFGGIGSLCLVILLIRLFYR